MSEGTAREVVDSICEEMFEQAVPMSLKLVEQVALFDDTCAMHLDSVKDLWDTELWVSPLADWPGDGLPGVEFSVDAYRWMFVERMGYALGLAI